ncbi:MAG: hypothetical protein Q4C13_08990 [Clostridia bacterium]|nr:hypothetical protein [Clostridia bacterium]
MKQFLTISAALALSLCLGACSPAAIEPDGPPMPDAPAAAEPSPAAAAQAPDAEAALPAPAEGMTRLMSETADLDGDGVAEHVLLDSDDEFQAILTVVSDGQAESQPLEYPYAPRLYTLHALFGGDTRQIIISGDTGSDDYMTWVFAYEGGALRGLCLDGYPEELGNGGTLVMSTYIHILGTYGATRAYTVAEDLSAASGEEYIITAYEGYEEERTLTVQKEGLSAKTAAGEEIALPVGTTLLLRSTNLIDTARCSTNLGEDVYLAVELPQDDWEWRICGAPESEWFGELFYAG